MRVDGDEGREGVHVFRSLDLQSESFFVEAVVVFDLIQTLFLERSFDPV